MAVYQEKAKERIKKSLPRIQKIVEKGKEESFKEADTRKIVQDTLTRVLGWDAYANVTAEQMISSRFADFVIKTETEELFVVEIKQIGLKLKEAHLNQARQYAVDEGIEWVILTNGDDWQVYRIVFEGKIPLTKLVFSVTMSDKEMKPAAKTELLYLLSEEANRKKEIDAFFDRHIALSGENLADLILSDKVINALRNAIKANTGQKLKNSEVAEALLDHLFRPEMIGDSHHKAIKKMVRDEKPKTAKEED